MGKSIRVSIIKYADLSSKMQEALQGDIFSTYMSVEYEGKCIAIIDDDENPWWLEPLLETIVKRKEIRK